MHTAFVPDRFLSTRMNTEDDSSGVNGLHDDDRCHFVVHRLVLTTNMLGEFFLVCKKKN